MNASQQTTSGNAGYTPAIEVRAISTGHPWQWIAAGAADLRQAAPVSLAYGAYWVVLSVALVTGLILSGLHHWLLPVASGFMFLGPMVAVGTYAISRQIERGEDPGLGDAFRAWGTNSMQVALMGVALMVFMLAWLRIATILFALFFAMDAPDPASLYSALFLTPNGLGMMAVGTAVGAILAFGAFTISVISIPLLLDRQVSVLEAIEASIRSVALNFRPLLLWAAILTLFVLVGMLTFFIGLIVIVPLLGHASWHAYRDLTGSSFQQGH